jgi:hypothetical protein
LDLIELLVYEIIFIKFFQDEPEKLTKAAMASTTSQRNTQQQEPNNNNDGSSFKSQDQIMPSEDNE